MLFNSFEFLLFICAFSICYFLIPKRKVQNLILLAFSYFFYGFWDIRFLYLIVLSSYVDFFCGLIIKKEFISLANRVGTSLFLFICSVAFIEINWKTLSLSYTGYGFGSAVFVILLLNILFNKVHAEKVKNNENVGVWISLTVNLVILGFFKYFNFFITSFVDVLEGFNLNANVTLLNIVLPVGISFYTFQTISYSLDIKNDDIKPTKDFLDFSVFVSFFPQLVAGTY